MLEQLIKWQDVAREAVKFQKKAEYNNQESTTSTYSVKKLGKFKEIDDAFQPREPEPALDIQCETPLVGVDS